MSTPLVTIIIITWNSLKYLPYCLKSIFDQTFKDFSIIIIDNGSTDGTIDFIRKEYPQTTLLQNRKNLGFAQANNQGIKLAKTKYILLCNTDIILEKDFLKNAVTTIQSNNKIASVGGKLLKVKWDKEELPKPIKTDIIDSCGIKIHKSHQATEIAVNEKDRGQYNTQKEVFGISGALVLYRRSTLENVKYNQEYFDENYFSYKEDIDLAWRLKLVGYKSIFIPKAIAYHFRSISQKDTREFRPKLLNQLSYKNHFLSIIKNQTLINLIIYSSFILWYELKKFIYILILEQSTLPALFTFFKQLPQTLQKRNFIISNKKISSKEIRKWFK